MTPGESQLKQNILVYSTRHVNPTTNRNLRFPYFQPRSSRACSTTVMTLHNIRRPMEHLSDIDIAKILALAKASTSERKIASLIKCSKTSVHDTLNTYDFETFQGHNPRREYQRKTTKCEDWYIERALKQYESVPLYDITNIIGLPRSGHMVRRHRSEAGLGSYVVAEKPGLHPENVAARLEWALHYKD